MLESLHFWSYFFLLYINDLLDSVNHICNIAFYADDVLLFSGLWQQFLLVSEHESDVQRTVDLRKK